jgi:hypothetical protein
LAFAGFALSRIALATLHHAGESDNSGLRILREQLARRLPRCSAPVDAAVDALLEAQEVELAG